MLLPETYPAREGRVTLRLCATSRSLAFACSLAEGCATILSVLNPEEGPMSDENNTACLLYTSGGCTAMGSLFRLTGDTVTPSAGTRVLKASEAAVLLEANAVLDAARERVAAMERKAGEAYERRREEGYRDGVEEGRLEHAEKVMETVLSSVEMCIRDRRSRADRPLRRMPRK